MKQKIKIKNNKSKMLIIIKLFSKYLLINSIFFYFFLFGIENQIGSEGMKYLSESLNSKYLFKKKRIRKNGNILDNNLIIINIFDIIVFDNIFFLLFT